MFIIAKNRDIYQPLFNLPYIGGPAWCLATLQAFSDLEAAFVSQIRQAHVLGDMGRSKEVKQSRIWV